jgi:hypothetical protein
MTEELKRIGDGLHRLADLLEIAIRKEGINPDQRGEYCASCGRDTAVAWIDNDCPVCGD